ncbi:hypothetical protein OWV82_006204 [Melia azedarach]|uniref:Uncharacterized protein n=1 Tax=Melia azedarach TaxID=155640 RepID=A0ACC1YH68_MELAZ|nr:hypothetical protein OWV82_006204 [Melia azedarach]
MLHLLTVSVYGPYFPTQHKLCFLKTSSMYLIFAGLYKERDFERRLQQVLSSRQKDGKRMPSFVEWKEESGEIQSWAEFG